MTYQIPIIESPATATAPTDNTVLNTLPSEGFIRVMPLAQRIGVHHQTLRKWWKTGKFPKPQHRNGILLFSNADVKQWIANQPKVIA